MSTNHDEPRGTEDSERSLLDEFDKERLLASADPETVKTVTKLLLGAGGLVFLLALVSVLPGLDRVVPATPITFASLAVAVLTLGIVAALAYVAPHLETLVRDEVPGRVALATNVGAVVKHLVVLLAVLVAYRGLAGAVVPFLAETGSVWAYDLTFLVLALVPTARIALHLYRGLDPAADLTTQRLTATTTPEETDADATETTAGADGDDEPARADSESDTQSTGSGSTDSER